MLAVRKVTRLVHDDELHAALVAAEDVEHRQLRTHHRVRIADLPRQRILLADHQHHRHAHAVTPRGIPHALAILERELTARQRRGTQASVFLARDLRLRLIRHPGVGQQ
jgi:hypothetical protein